MSYDLHQYQEGDSLVKSYPGYIVNSKYQRVLAPGGGAGEPHRSRGPWDGVVGGRHKEWIDIECAR